MVLLSITSYNSHKIISNVISNTPKITVIIISEKFNEIGTISHLLK